MALIHFDAPQGVAAHIQIEHIQVVRRSPMQGCLASANAKGIASIIKIPPDGGVPQGEITYGSLICTEEDRQKIATIITTMAENGKIALLFRATEMKRLGAKINHVHPLKFLGAVFSNPQLKTFMREIYGDYFKWNGFMDGLAPSLTSQADRGKLDAFLPDFAKEVGTSADELRGYTQSRDWEGLVRFLMEI